MRLIFCSALLRRAVVGDGGGLDDNGGLVHAAEDSGAHFVCRDDGDDFAVRRRTQRSGRGDQNDARAAALGSFGEGISHFAAGAVAEEADRVESFAGASGGDEHGFAGKIVAVVQNSEDGFHDGGRVGEPSAAGHAAGEVSAVGRDDVDVARG